MPLAETTHGTARCVQPIRFRNLLMIPNHLRYLRLCALLESTTLLLLLGVAVPLKHLAAWPLGVSIMGPIHGAAFVLYVWRLSTTASYAAWPARLTARLLVAALIPFGGLLVARYLRQQKEAQPTLAA